jgi:hypothetical protein
MGFGFGMGAFAQVVLFAAAGAALAQVGSHEVSTPGQTSSSYVRVTVNVSAGPYGLAVYPTGGTSVSSIPPAGVSTYNYPSIVVMISATPLLTPKSGKNDNFVEDPDKIDHVDGTNSVVWMDVTSELTALDRNGREAECGADPCLRIIGILPGTTSAALKPQAVATTVEDLSKLATATVGLYPGVGSIVTTAAAGAQVVFNDLFPPKNTANQFAYLDNSTPKRPTFGWFFQANDAATPPTSILGIQIGEVMLQADPKVTSVKISGRSLSQWKNPPNGATKKKYSYSTYDQTLSIAPNGINYAYLMDLKQFPIVIPREQVEKILGVDDGGYEELVKAPNPSLVTTSAKHDYVTKASLQKYLGVSQ